ncbi:MAG: hypothetical protein HY905_16865 [Deltaproteobacteria bacterium]|nr:hypothetical protein [Deltaproteobacteria bacterium]
MKRLEAVRLVQWYHFQDETFPIGGSCLLLGDNGSGKTTVLDAIQVALVANLSEVLLNRAANEKSRRSLLGYVRWKIGSEDESRPGAVRYGRGACTSYVLLEFRDDEDPGQGFTCGIGFEATETDSDVAKAQFVVPGARVSDVEVVVRSGDGQEREVVRPLRDFRAWVRSRGALVWQEAGTYREELRQRLGVLPESFHRLIVKALAFKPIGQVRQFVFDYLLDPRPIDTDALQLNLDNYKRLEGEAKDAAARISELEKIVQAGERIRTEQRTVESHRFMELRADSEGARTKLERLVEQLAQTRARLQGLATRRDAVEAELPGLERELDRVLRVLEGLEIYRQLRDLERQIEDTKRALGEAEAADHEARKLMRVQTEALDTLLSEEARAFRRLRPELFERDDILGAEDAPEVVARLRRTLGSEGALAGRDLATWERRLDRAADRVRQARLVAQMELEAAKGEGAALQDEQRMLEAGRQRYPDGPAALLHLLATRLKSDRREPKPLCELIEVPNVRWRNAVEGYLGGRRFDVVVAPEDFSRALGLFERHKREYPLPGRGTVFIGGVGLVDVERVLRAASRCVPRSLAEQVETADAYARAYCDYVLGEVVCVDDEQSLRKHAAAITDTVMVYRSHVARQTPREVFSRHYIGEAARLRRLDEIASRLGELHERFVLVAGQVDWLGRAVQLLDKARAEARRLPDLVERAEGVVNLRLQVVRLAETKEKIDRSGIRELEETRAELGKRRAARLMERDAILKEIGTTEEQIRGGEGELGRAESEAAHADGELRAFAEPLEAATGETYAQRYERERAERSPEQIHEIFERQRRVIEKRVENLVVGFVLLKSKYVDHRGFAGTVEGSEFAEFATELEVWRDSRLPDYEQKISEAKRKALEQLAEDVVFRLRENLLLVRRQIDELNRALRDVRFGTEGYQFTVEVEPEHRDFYNVVIDAGRYEKESLFGAAALAAPEVKTSLGDLLDRLIESEAKDVKTELEARADYREYFRYDLKILHADGGYSLYDKVSGDKSGGETQTPYYIAILASMYRLYRSRSRDDRPACGLVLLDEAFGKMDESRVAATLRFARRLGLQLVLATPKERSELVAPRVERSLLIHKDAIGGAPTVLDFTKEFARDEEDDVVGAGGDPGPVAREPRA